MRKYASLTNISPSRARFRPLTAWFLGPTGVHRCKKNVQIKILKNVKNVTKIKQKNHRSIFVNVIKKRYLLV